MSYIMTMFGLCVGLVVNHLLVGMPVRDAVIAAVWISCGLFTHWLLHGGKR